MRTWITTWMSALCAAALVTVAAPAQKSGDMLDHLIVSASADSWAVLGGASALRDDAGVKGGKATRVSVHKGANPWDVQATITIPQAVNKGDILLAVYYARIETPPAGAATGVISQSGIQLTKAPYTAIGAEPAAPSNQWGVYYASGTATADQPKGSLGLTLHLASADQVVDLGPVFLFNLGSDWDRSKIPHNKVATAAAPAASPETAYAADLAKIRAKLPVQGRLINDPGQIYSYGPDITMSELAASDITGGKAKRLAVAKPGVQAYDDGASSPIQTAIKKGDVIFTAVLLRASETSGASASIPELGIHLASAPYTPIAVTPANLPKGQWVWALAHGIAAADYAPGATGFGIQLASAKQTIDIGPVYVLNLGPGVDLATLPKGL
jgi:hypothetical protein